MCSARPGERGAEAVLAGAVRRVEDGLRAEVVLGEDREARAREGALDRAARVREGARDRAARACEGVPPRVVEVAREPEDAAEDVPLGEEEALPEEEEEILPEEEVACSLEEEVACSLEDGAETGFPA